MARALLLDLDKTLVNVEDHVDYCAALAAARVEAAAGPVRVDAPPTTWGPCARGAMELLVALAGDGDRWVAASRAIERYETAGARRSTAMPGLAAFLEALAGRPAAIVTLLGPVATEVVLERHRIAVEAVVARAPGLRPKPHPDQVLEALRVLEVSPGDAVMLGDASWDEAAARAAGVTFVGLRNGRPDPGFAGSTIVEDLEGAAAALRGE